jgi:hypothetical protein
LHPKVNHLFTDAAQVARGLAMPELSRPCRQKSPATKKPTGVKAKKGKK